MASQSSFKIKDAVTKGKIKYVEASDVDKIRKDQHSLSLQRYFFDFLSIDMFVFNCEKLGSLRIPIWDFMGAINPNRPGGAILPP